MKLTCATRTKLEIIDRQNPQLHKIVAVCTNHHCHNLFGGNHRNTQRNRRDHAGQESDPLDGTSLLVSGRLDIEGSIDVSLLVQDSSAVIQYACVSLIYYFSKEA